MTSKTGTINNRSYALDAFRGYAIVTMVLSATVVYGILPGWMYHGQIPPPSHAFSPDVPGITWVDLVFPFFLFAMGAAFPFSIRKKVERGESPWMQVYRCVKRAAELTFFAIFIQHFYPWALSNPQDSRAWGLSLLCFALLFPMFMRIPIKMSQWAHTVVKLGAYAVAFVLLYTVDYAGDRTFNLHFSNIIILILANMALFGSLVYTFTLRNRWIRLGVLPLIMGVILGAELSGSISQAIFKFTPLDWMFRFDYLKYLFIILPGSIAGEYLVEWMQDRNNGSDNEKAVKYERFLSFAIPCIALAVIIVNLCCLYKRWLTENLIINIALLLAGILLLRKANTGNSALWRKLFTAGAYLIIAGLFFEDFQTGIKKDPATFSYLLLTSGLAFIALLIFHVVCDYYNCYKSTSFLIMPGQNPMIAYVAPNLFIIPLLFLTGIYPLFDVFAHNAWLGFLQGVILTSLSVLVTMFFTKIKWFWRT